ncbi:MAG: aldo/keto reductase [Proteobacteria bacterium]|nr:aldo/keto reductase [Pseudomonadota bacterium]MCP4919315.1 aldo/keto reductase [Pseudomonadota bacterium]
MTTPAPLGPIAAGTNRFRPGPKAAAARRAWTAEGPVLFDSAEIYGLGRSERALAGEALVATKIMPHPWRRPGGLADALTASLARLEASTVRLCLLHFPTRWRDNSGWVRALAAEVHTGRAQGIGVSNHDLGQLREAWRVANEEGVPLEVVQDEYHLDKRGVEAEILPFCQEHGITFQAFRPLDGGRLPSSEALPFLLERRVQPVVGTLNPDHVREALGYSKQLARVSPTI